MVATTAGGPTDGGDTARSVDNLWNPFAGNTYLRGMADTVEWAAHEATHRLAPLGRRLTHVLAVAERAHIIGPPTVGDASAMLVTAALLHDIGYAPELATTRFHPLDGARFCRAAGHAEIAVLVAHHTGARHEAALRGLLPELLEDFPFATH